VSTQTRAYGVSFGIHALVISGILAIGFITPTTRTVLLDFNLASSAKSRLVPAPIKRSITPARDRKSVTPMAPVEETVPIKKETVEEANQPVTQQRVSAETKADASDNNSASLSAGAAEAAKEEFISAHFRSIRDKIFRNLGYPPLARRMGWSGKVIVSFTVGLDGSAEDISVVESSSYAALDKNAIEAVKKSCPLPKPTIKVVLLMPIVYRLE